VPRNPGGAAAPARASRSLDKPAAPDQGGKAAKGLRSGSAAGPRSAHRAGAGTRGRACRRDRGMRPVRHSSQVRAHWSAGRTRWSSGRGAAPRAASTAARLKRAYSASRLRSERARACAASSSSCSSSSCACRANRSESQRKGGAPRDSGLSRSPRSLHGCMPRTRVTTSPAVRLLACAGLDSVQAGLAGGQTWQRGVRLETQSLPCTDRDMRLLRQAHTCARNSFRALDMQSAQPPRASTSTCPQYAGRACARRGCKMRVAPAPAAHQRLLGQQRGVLLQARDTPLRRGLLSALRRAAVTPAGLVCLLVGVQRSDVGLLHARAIGVRSA